MSVQMKMFSSVIIDELVCYDETGKSEMQDSLIVYLFIYLCIFF